MPFPLKCDFSYSCAAVDKFEDFNWNGDSFAITELLVSPPVACVQSERHRVDRRVQYHFASPFLNIFGYYQQFGRCIEANKNFWGETNLVVNLNNLRVRWARQRLSASRSWHIKYHVYKGRLHKVVPRRYWVELRQAVRHDCQSPERRVPGYCAGWRSSVEPAPESGSDASAQCLGRRGKSVAGGRAGAPVVDRTRPPAARRQAPTWPCTDYDERRLWRAGCRRRMWRWWCRCGRCLTGTWTDTSVGRLLPTPDALRPLQQHTYFILPRSNTFLIPLSGRDWLCVFNRKILLFDWS